MSTDNATTATERYTESVKELNDALEDQATLQQSALPIDFVARNVSAQRNAAQEQTQQNRERIEEQRAYQQSLRGLADEEQAILRDLAQARQGSRVTGRGGWSDSKSD